MLAHRGVDPSPTQTMHLRCLCRVVRAFGSFEKSLAVGTAPALVFDDGGTDEEEHNDEVEILEK